MANPAKIEPVDADVASGVAALDSSRTLEESALADLKQHRRWLKRHAAAEQRNRVKHHRRLKQLKRSQRRWVKRQLFLRATRRNADAVAAACYSATLYLADKAGVAASTFHTPPPRQRGGDAEHPQQTACSPFEYIPHAFMTPDRPPGLSSHV